MNTSQQNKQEEKGNIIAPRQLLLHEIAHTLVEARTAKQEALSKPVRKLKIPANHLQALENGNWETLPDDVYVIGFLRQYSKYLGIDLSDEIDRLKNPDYKLTRPLTFPDPPVAPSRLWAWLTGGAFVVLFVLFNVISTDDDPAESTQSHIASVAQSTHQPAENSSSKQEVSVQHAPAKKASAATPTAAAVVADNVTATTATVRKTEIAAATTAKIANKQTEKTDKLVASSAPAVAVAKPAHIPTLPSQPATQAEQPGNTAMHLFRFEAVTAPVWMQIFLPNQAGDGKGRLLKEMLLKKGHSANIRYATETLWITCGNALALRIKVDRKTIVKTGGLGAGKKILRDYRFDINMQ